VKSAIPGPKVILLGDSGTGKTYSIKTLLDAGLTPFIIFTEPGMETIGDVLDKCHWTYIPPGQIGWDGLMSVAKMVNTLDYEGVAKMQDANKRKYDEFLRVLSQCNKFVDQNGEDWGDVTEFGTDKVLVIDSLSGLNDMASQLVVGGKPVKGMQDWQVAQNMLKKVIDKLCTSCHCSVVLMAHIAREKNEITGGETLYVSTLGKALAPDLPAYFSDVIQTVRTGNVWTWDVAGTNIAVKGRNIEFKSKQQPSFKPLIEAWKRRGGVIEASVNS
jgi:hypothetical protein